MHIPLITLALTAVSAVTIAQDSKPRPKSAPKVLLRYQFKKGDKGTYQMRRNMMNAMPRADTPSQSVTLHDYSWEVVEEGEVAVVEWSLDRLRQWNGPFGKFDGTWDHDTNNEGGFPGEMMMQAVGEKIRFEIDSRGRVKILDVEDKTQLYLMRYEIQSVIRQLPELPVGIGDRWESEFKSEEGADLVAKTTFRNRLVSYGKGRVRVAFEIDLDQGPAVKVTADLNRGFVDLDLRRFIPERTRHDMRMKLGLGNNAFEIRQTMEMGPPGKFGPVGVPGDDRVGDPDPKKKDAPAAPKEKGRATSRPTKKGDRKD